MQDYNILDTIDKYDSISDSWTLMYFRLPKPLAKLGAVLLHDEAILIAGGMSKDYEPSGETYELCLITLEWTQRESMFDPRLPSSGLVFSQDSRQNSYVYAIGGNKTQRCERYIVNDQVWEQIPSFKPKVEEEEKNKGIQNNLFTYSMCSSL